MRHKTTQTLLDHFNRMRGEKSVPLRSDLDPMALRTVLPDVFLLELERGQRLRFRLAGTRLCAILGRELRGEEFEMAWCRTDRHKINLAAEGVLASQAPAIATVRAIAEDDTSLDLEMLLLPMASRPGTVDRLLGCLVNLTPGFPSEEHRQLRAESVTYLSTELRGLSFGNRVFHAPPELTAHPAMTSGTRSPHLRVLQGGKN